MAKSFKPGATTRIGMAALMGGAVLCTAAPASAEEWSDTAISYRTGSKFHEPFNTKDISKNIIGLTHAGGYKYGTNFFNADILMSDSNDPGGGTAGRPGAQEVYVVYRNTVDLSKVTGKPYKWGFIRGVGGTFGFDINTKNDFYASKKRMLVLGPTLMLDVPGFLNVSLLYLDESNAPSFNTSRWSYKGHAMLTAAWGIPIPVGGLPLSFEGFMNIIGSKGPLDSPAGLPSTTETNFDGQIMLDVGSVMGGPKGTFKLGFEYQYWKNKFGNNHDGPAGPGAFAKTPMIRAEYHF